MTSSNGFESNGEDVRLTKRRHHIAQDLFSEGIDDDDVNEIIEELGTRGRALNQFKKSSNRTAEAWRTETCRAFTATYTLYLAHAHSEEIAAQVDAQCKNLERMIPKLSDRIVHAYVSSDPEIINAFGPALVGAAMAQMTPEDVLDALETGDETYSSLAIKNPE